LQGGREGRSEGTPEQLDALIEQALERASSAANNSLAGPVSRLGNATKGLGIDDRRYPMLTDADRIEVVATNRRAATSSARVEAGTFTYKDRRERRAFANTKGVMLEVFGTRYDASGSVSLRAGTGNDLKEHIAGRAFASIACLPFGGTLVKRATSLLELAPPIDGPIRVLFRPRATGKLFAWLAPLFDVAVLREGKTLLHRDGRLVELHRKIHLVDDGGLSGGLHTRAFDDRGVPSVPLTLIREGLIDARFLHVEAARDLETRPTGHQYGDHVGPTNLQVNSGVRSINAHMGEQPGPVFALDDLPDLAKLDRATGEIDVPVSGHLLQGHTVVGARRQARLRGNIIDALQQVAAITSDTDRILHVDSPGIFMDGLRIEG
jgi:PmbA protein